MWTLQICRIAHAPRGCDTNRQASCANRLQKRTTFHTFSPLCGLFNAQLFQWLLAAEGSVVLTVESPPAEGALKSRRTGARLGRERFRSLFRQRNRRRDTRARLSHAAPEVLSSFQQRTRSTSSCLCG